MTASGDGRAFRDRYGPWALVAGASEGIGAAFARALAARGLDLVLVARRPEPLVGLAQELAATTPAVTVRTVAADLATRDGLAAVATATTDLGIGMVVCNAAYSPIGAFLGLAPNEAERALDLNCRAPLWLAGRFLPGMAARGRGGFVVLSSLAGQQGAPSLAVYAATKAFGAVLAEGLWAELRGSGVDVLTVVAGAVTTPGAGRAISRPAPGTISPEMLVTAALRALGKGPRTVPGRLMAVSSVLMARLLPRRAAIAVFGRSSRGLVPTGPPPVEKRDPAP